MKLRDELEFNIIHFIIVTSTLIFCSLLGFWISDKDKKKADDIADKKAMHHLIDILIPLETPTPYPNGTIVMLSTGPDCFDKLKILNHINTPQGYYYKYYPECEKNISWYHTEQYHKAESIRVWDDKADAICPCGEVN